MNLYCFEEMEDEEEKENEKDYTFEDLLNYCNKIIRNTEGIDMDTGVNSRWQYLCLYPGYNI